MKVLLIGGSGFIGKELTATLESYNHDVTIADIVKENWLKETEYLFLDISKKESIQNLNINEFHVIVNLAAKTDDSSECLSDYFINFAGVFLLIQKIIASKFQGKFIQISTQYVSAPIGYNRKSKYFSDPVNTYGESKLIAEHLVSNSDLQHWTILRPTNVWGPGHRNFSNGFWRIIERGFYVHPKGKVMRSYGSVFTVSRQILRIIELDKTKSNQKILYLGSEPMDSYRWVNEFSKNIRGKNVRRVNRFLILIIALIAEIGIKIFQISLPLSLKRYRSITKDYVVDMNDTFSLIGYVDSDFCDEVRITSDWYLKYRESR